MDIGVNRIGIKGDSAIVVVGSKRGIFHGNITFTKLVIGIS